MEIANFLVILYCCRYSGNIFNLSLETCVFILQIGYFWMDNMGKLMELHLPNLITFSI